MSEMTLEKAGMLGDGYVDGMEDWGDVPRLPTIPPPPVTQSEVPAPKPLVKVIGTGLIFKQAPVTAPTAPKLSKEEKQKLREEEKRKMALHRRACEELKLKKLVLLAGSGAKLPEGITASVEENILTITQDHLKVKVKDAEASYFRAAQYLKDTRRLVKGRLKPLYFAGDLPAEAVVKITDAQVVVKFGDLCEQFADHRIIEAEAEKRREEQRKKLLAQNAKAAEAGTMPTADAVYTPAASGREAPGWGEMKGTTRKPKVKGKKPK